MDSNYFKRLQAIKQRDIEVLLKKSYRGIWETAIKKYSDTAHFVYELLQNADDAGATRAEFELLDDGLWFKHNGRIQFTISNPETEEGDSEKGQLGHINAITSIGNSTKIDAQKIGKFGIGFKAVFAYCNTPHVYDDRFSFKLESYIVPIELNSIPDRKRPGETLFYFPFDHPGKSVMEAFSEILNKLESLFQPILFLRNLKEIVWATADQTGEYGKQILETKQFEAIDASLLEVWSVKQGSRKPERIWLFETQAEKARPTSNHRLGVAFFITPENLLETGCQYEAFCFFPTKEETKLGFMIQAPFLLTDNREGIKVGDTWNLAMISGLADLAAQSLVLLKVLGDQNGHTYFHDAFLEYIPYRKPGAQDALNKSRISFDPFYHAILKQLQSAPLLPGRDGKCYQMDHAYWASDPELTELFKDEQLSMLMENPSSGWVFLSKGQKQLNQANKPLEEYISSIVTEVVDPKKLIRRITAKFTEAQSDEWLIKFYAYLGGRRSLWDDRDSLALKRPILLNQKRKGVVPFDDANKVFNIFLPVGRKTSYDTIWKDHVVNPEALVFFNSLGIKVPDLGDEIIKDILPQYKDDFDYSNDDLLLQHLEAFLTYYGVCPAADQHAFLERLKTVSFVATQIPMEPDQRWFRMPTECYFSTANLQSYFTRCPEVYLLDMEYYESKLGSQKLPILMEMLKKLGVADRPRPIEKLVIYDMHSIAKFQLGQFELSRSYQSDNIIKDTLLEGMVEAIEAINFANSILIWHYLLELLGSKSWESAYSIFSGSFTYLGKGHWYSRRATITSTLILTARNSIWLYDSQGNLLSASEITNEELHPDYDLTHFRAKDLLDFLGIKSVEGDAKLTDEQRLALTLGREILREGLSMEEVQQIIAAHLQKQRRTQNTNEQPDGEEGMGGVDGPSLDDFLGRLKKEVTEIQEESAKPNDPTLPPKNEQKDIEDASADEDEYTRPSIDLQKRSNQLMADAAAQMEELFRIEKLHQVVAESDLYSFRWFKALLELEYLSSAEANSNEKSISLQFATVEMEPGTNRILVLKHPNRYIPQSIEDIGDLHIQLMQAEVTTTVTIEVVSVKEYTLRAKVKSTDVLKGIDLGKVTSAQIDVKNPVFILAELRRSFQQLPLADSYNLRDNLTRNIKFIFGPPGTGKTTILAVQEIIPKMKDAEAIKVLVLAPTNKAADVLTTRIISQMGGDESYLEWLIRFGTSADPDLENSAILKDNRFDISTMPRNTTITTVARFAYDYFRPEGQNEKFYLKSWDWDYIIVDEASMVTIANIAFILYQRPTAQFIVAGDPFQIQPIAQINTWKEMNIYAMVELHRFAKPATVPHDYPVQLLTTQYRSIPSIGSVFSYFVYDGILKHHRTYSEQRPLLVPGLEFNDINLIKFPVAKYESIYRPNRLNKSNYQIYSALFAVEFIQRLSSILSNAYPEGYRIGVICPYRAQATLVGKMLSHLPKGEGAVDIQIGTIHGFQGDECDLILAILNPPREITTSTEMFLNKRNILNVAISRARDYLFVLMPDDETANVENLQGIKTIERLVANHAAGRSTVYHASVVEEALFGSPTYIYDNSFATSHQSVNVYSKPAKKYEVRCEEVAVDVQMGFE